MSFRSQLNKAAGRWWRENLVDEGPKARIERIYFEHIEDIEIHNALREAMRLWEIENRKSQVREIEYA